MTDTTVRVHRSFWVIGSVALLWNLMGCVNFFVQMEPDVLARYRDSEQAIVASRPLWATAGFALGVFGGALGSVLLLLRRQIAVPVFVLSLLGVLVATAHTLSIGVSFSAGEAMGIIVTPVVFAAFLVRYAKHAERRGWVGNRRRGP
jgi:hypothetical protein